MRDQYHYDALNHLFVEASLREVAHQQFFDEANVIPYTIVYEDFIRSFEETVLPLLR